MAIRVGEEKFPWRNKTENLNKSQQVLSDGTSGRPLLCSPGRMSQTDRTTDSFLQQRI